MRKFTIGLFGLAILLGNQLGSMFGIAVAICIFMMLDGILEEISLRSKTNKPKKEWVNYAARTSNRNSNNFTGHQRGESEGLKQKDESTKEEA